MNETIVVKMLGMEHQVHFPKWGEFMDIENLKLQLTGGKYSVLALNSGALKNHNVILDIVDAIATFTVLIPKFREMVKIKTLDEIEMNEDLLEIVDAYNDQYMPFYESIIERPKIRRLFKLPPKEEDNGQEKG